MNKIERMFNAIGFTINHTKKVGWWVDGNNGFGCSGYHNTKEAAVLEAVKKILDVENGNGYSGNWYQHHL